jgi:hypothetical protein
MLQAFLIHFRMKLFLAAPESFLPSALTAFGKHVWRLHLLRKLFSAAPASGLLFLPTALLAHVSCVIAGLMAKPITMTAERTRFMACFQAHLTLITILIAPQDAQPLIQAPA